MANGNEETTNPTEEMTDAVKNQGKKAGKAVANKGKQVAKKAMKEAGKKIAKKIAQSAIKLMAKLLAKLVAIALPYIVPILIIVAIAIAGFYIIYEIRGTEQVYVYDEQAKNETDKDLEKGYDKTDQSKSSGQTQAIQTYYKYMSQHSYWQIITDDNTKLEQDTGVLDYYNKEKEYYLNSNFLFSLDETMHKKKFIYPEQFVKPVAYDPDKLELKNLTDKKGNIVVESEEYNEEGDKTGKKVKNVADYGIGSIFKYKKDEKTVTVEGTMYEKDVWNAELNKKETIKVDEPFEYTMEGYPEEIWLMTKAITFAGEFSFTYEDQKTKTAGLSDNDTPGAKNQAVKKIQIGQGKQMKTEYYYETEYYDSKEIDENGEEHIVVKSKRVRKSRQVFDKWVPLYGYRKGGVYETVPVQKEAKPNDKGQKYLRDFLYNYKIYTPKSVMGDFNLEERGVTGTGMSSINMETGSGKDSEKLANSMRYFGIAEQYGKQFGVDPYLIIAIMAQESGGNPTVNHKGLMQIIGLSSRQIKAKDASGTWQSFTISVSGRQNPDDAIHWATMYLKYLHDFFDGDSVKATLAYNMGEGTVDSIRKNHPEDWNTDNWVTHIPEANNAKINGNGDNDYLSHVFQYYVGSGGTPTEQTETAKDEDKGMLENIKDAVTDAVKKLYSALVADYSEETKYYPYDRFVSPRDVDWALRFATAMDKYILFTETDNDKEDLQFWEVGYADTMTTGDVANYVANTEVAGFQSPLNVANPVITSLPGWRTDPVYGDRRHHGGTDIAVPKNTPIYAMADGTVKATHTGETYNNGAGLGNYVMLTHANGFESHYGHLTSFPSEIKVGTTVKKGQLIGYSGSTGKSTGYHLHFTVKHNGVLMDSSQIIKGEQGVLRPAPM